MSRLPGYAGLAPPALRDVLYEHERLLKALREGAAAAFEHWHRGLACLELLWPSGPGDADA